MRNWLYFRISKSILNWIKQKGSSSSPNTIVSVLELVQLWITIREKELASQPQDMNLQQPPEVYDEQSADSVQQREVVNPISSSNSATAMFSEQSLCSISHEPEARGRWTSRRKELAQSRRKDRASRRIKLANGRRRPGQCETCLGTHPDVNECPDSLAKQDFRYASNADVRCSWKCGGRLQCGGKSHLAKHHRCPSVGRSCGTSVRPSQYQSRQISLRSRP